MVCEPVSVCRHERRNVPKSKPYLPADPTTIRAFIGDFDLQAGGAVDWDAGSICLEWRQRQQRQDAMNKPSSRYSNTSKAIAMRRRKLAVATVPANTGS
jgi:hypothetical protein